MALADLIATPGEIAASRITQTLDIASHDAHERLFRAIKEAVDGAVAAEREGLLLREIKIRAAEREACAQIAEYYAAKSAFGYATLIAVAIRARGEAP